MTHLIRMHPMTQCEVNLSDLRRKINLIFDHIEIDLGITQITLDQEDYWHAMPPEKYDVRHEIKDLGIGKLSDDWEFLCNMTDDRREAVALMLLHVAPLLECIGEQVGQ